MPYHKEKFSYYIVYHSWKNIHYTPMVWSMSLVMRVNVDIAPKFISRVILLSCTFVVAHVSLPTNQSPVLISVNKTDQCERRRGGGDFDNLSHHYHVRPPASLQYPGKNINTFIENLQFITSILSSLSLARLFLMVSW